MLTKKFFCPVNGWDCPYWKEDGSCSIVDEGDEPAEECDDAAFFYVDDEDDYQFVWEDEDGNRYDTQELLEKGYHFIDGEPVDAEMWEKILAYKKELEHAPCYVNTSGVSAT